MKKLQPDAVVFSDAGPDVRWCGNETGTAGDPNWSAVDPVKVPYPGVSGPGITDALQHGDPDGTVWRPAEADTSIRRGWFYHPAEDTGVRTVDQLVNLYFLSVGRNSKLLLNVPPTRDGWLHEIDVARLAGMHARLAALFAEDFAAGRSPSRAPAGEQRRVVWTHTGARTAEAEVDLGRTVTASIVRLAEDITAGQDIAGYAVFGSDGNDWQPLSQGRTIGYAKLDRFQPTAVRRVRVVIEDAVARPRPIGVGVFGG